MRAALAAVLLLAVAGCGVGQVASPDAEGAQGSALGDLSPLTAPTAQALVSSNLATDAEVRALLHVRDEAGYDVFVAPAIPGPGDRLIYAVLLPQGFPLAPGSSEAQATSDGWATTRAVAGSTFAVGDRPAVLFDLGKASTGTTVQAAFKLGGNLAYPVWLNNDSKNYAATVVSAKTLSWAGNARFVQDGLPRAILQAEPLFAGHDLTVHLQSYPESPGVAPVVHWTADGFATIHDAAMAIEAIHGGETGHDTLWAATLPVAALASGAKVVSWVEVVGPKNTVWDSNGGQNYSALVSTAPQPAWGEVGVYAFTKGHPDGQGGYQAGWFYSSGLADPLSATPGDFQVYAANPYPAVELYVPGVTDRADAASVARGGFLKVEVYSPFFGSDPSAGASGHALELRETHGNNLRFAWSIVDRNAPHQPAQGAACPVDGSYAFKFRVSTDGGQSWQWLGLGALPSGGADRHMTWASLTYAPNVSTSGSTSFGRVQVNHSRTLHVTLVNTTNSTLQLTGITADRSLTATVTGCSSAATCSKTLAPGAQLVVSAKFHPTSAGAVAPALHLALTDLAEPCTGHGVQDLGFTGTGY